MMEEDEQIRFTDIKRVLNKFREHAGHELVAIIPTLLNELSQVMTGVLDYDNTRKLWHEERHWLEEPPMTNFPLAHPKTALCGNVFIVNLGNIKYLQEKNPAYVTCEECKKRLLIRDWREASDTDTKVD